MLANVPQSDTATAEPRDSTPLSLRGLKRNIDVIARAAQSDEEIPWKYRRHPAEDALLRSMTGNGN